VSDHPDPIAATFFPAATYLALAPLPVPPVWNNSLGPRIVVAADRLSFQCFGKAEIPFAEIVSVDHIGRLGHSIRIRRRGRRVRYVAWFLSGKKALPFLAALRDAGLPLTPRALAALT
jgi:hypothetical protein